ncbi:Lactamase B domain containing protein [Asbolus verrucosus]|uniref:Metallo-beta-lactamase domain-containing protein 1 n=1 Tax=Asbolus verrucosus TaxID=1661398 RepID=A0A482WD30_ASBVE|nr:Lactamase B domain containing protein [Asbolus verrucosus]
MTAWDGDKLITALVDHGINCEDINYVISTHGHSDHIGCNYLFPKATHIVGFCISQKDRYFHHDFKSGKEYRINDKITIIPTPGHTLQDVTVIINSGKGTIAITGDLFEREDDLSNCNIWKSAGSDSEELQVMNRLKILQLADYIIPGHGAMFKTDKYK